MRLFLIRHGESVDNVANLYAGSRDGLLTSHGVIQAKRLGEHLAWRAATIGPICRVFSSDLSRAKDTARLVLEAQAREDGPAGQISIVELLELREKDFGSLEGVRVGTLDREALEKSDSESHAAMQTRIDRFINEHLEQSFRDFVTQGQGNGTILVVAHGIILGVLLRSLAVMFPPEQPVRGNGYQAGDVVAWSNTGYTEVLVTCSRTHEAADHKLDGPELTPKLSTLLSKRNPMKFELIVEETNMVTHLRGLKKTRGGIGSSVFDNKQRTMESFFGPARKKPRTE